MFRIKKSLDDEIRSSSVDEIVAYVLSSETPYFVVEKKNIRGKELNLINETAELLSAVHAKNSIMAKFHINDLESDSEFEKIQEDAKNLEEAIDFVCTTFVSDKDIDYYVYWRDFDRSSAEIDKDDLEIYHKLRLMNVEVIEDLKKATKKFEEQQREKLASAEEPEPVLIEDVDSSQVASSESDVFARIDQVKPDIGAESAVNFLEKVKKETEQFKIPNEKQMEETQMIEKKPEGNEAEKSKQDEELLKKAEDMNQEDYDPFESSVKALGDQEDSDRWDESVYKSTGSEIPEEAKEWDDSTGGQQASKGAVPSSHKESEVEDFVEEEKIPLKEKLDIIRDDEAKDVLYGVMGDKATTSRVPDDKLESLAEAQAIIAEEESKTEEHIALEAEIKETKEFVDGEWKEIEDEDQANYETPSEAASIRDESYRDEIKQQDYSPKTMDVMQNLEDDSEDIPEEEQEQVVQEEDIIEEEFESSEEIPEDYDSDSEVVGHVSEAEAEDLGVRTGTPITDLKKLHAKKLKEGSQSFVNSEEAELVDEDYESKTPYTDRDDSALTPAPADLGVFEDEIEFSDKNFEEEFEVNEKMEKQIEELSRETPIFTKKRLSDIVTEIISKDRVKQKVVRDEEFNSLKEYVKEITVKANDALYKSLKPNLIKKVAKRFRGLAGLALFGAAAVVAACIGLELTGNYDKAKEEVENMPSVIEEINEEYNPYKRFTKIEDKLDEIDSKLGKREIKVSQPDSNGKTTQPDKNNGKVDDLNKRLKELEKKYPDAETYKNAHDIQRKYFGATGYCPQKNHEIFGKFLESFEYDNNFKEIKKLDALTKKIIASGLTYAYSWKAYKEGKAKIKKFDKGIFKEVKKDYKRNIERDDKQDNEPIYDMKQTIKSFKK